MYCINCGVKLADTEKKCPLCGTIPYHPDLVRQKADPLYPNENRPTPQVSHVGILIIISTLLLIPIFSCLFSDLMVNGKVVWSGYVIGALLLGYLIFVMPFWFRRPNPVIFVPIGFIAAGCFLLYVDLTMEGGWFLSFAFPVTGAIGAIVTAVAALLRYVRRGKLYIFGGASIAFGLSMLLIEFMMDLTFSIRFIGWSIYPCVSLALVGGLLIFFAICRPARESMERKFFI